jgi:ribonuclease/clavin/mitogillin
VPVTNFPCVIEQTDFGDVAALRLSWMRSRVVGYGVHVFVVRGALIDTGFPGAANDLRHIVKSFKVRGALLTHHHEDHAGNVQALARARMPLAIDDDTLALVRQPGRIGAYRHITWQAMRGLTRDVIPFDDASLTLVATPGHCANHHVVWDHDTGTLFGGDLFLGVKVRVAHAHEDPRALLHSLRAMVARAPARVFCAHRGFVPNAAAALTAKAEWLADVIGEIDRLDDGGFSDREISDRLLGGRTLTHYFSAGDYSPVNLVRGVRRSRVPAVV